jgi:hypothetical protein
MCSKECEALATVDEELRVFREKWSTVFAAEEGEGECEGEEGKLELELEREHRVSDERKEEQSYEKEVSENAVINKEYSIFEKASDEVTDDCNEEEEEQGEEEVQNLASDELSALGAIVRKEREDRAKREVVNTLRKNEREMEYVQMKARNNAQRIIAKYSRKWFHRRVVASLAMQRHAKGFLERVRLKHKTTMVVRIQRRWKLYLFMRSRTNASMSIQNAFRAYLRRRKLEKEKMEAAAATLIQTHVRRFITMRQYTILKRKIRMVQACAARWIRKRERASQIIQKSFRSYVEMKRLGKYATCIQAAFRGHRVRSRFAAILDLNECETDDDDALPTLSEYSSDPENVDDEDRNKEKIFDGDLFYFARLSDPRARDVKDTPTPYFRNDLHADILAMRTKEIRVRDKQIKDAESNLRLLYETKFKRNSANRRQFRRVRALRTS